MLAISLLYVGAVLWVNGMMLLGRVSGKGAAPLNLFTGSITLIINIYIMLKAPSGDPLSYFTAATGLLFSFTYLYVAINNAFDLEGRGFGWYCFFVAVTALPTAVLTFQSGDFRFGVIWLLWAFLWFLFFLLLALEKPIAKFTAYVTLVEAVITCWVPGYMLLTGNW
ncbi:AmiS/UreI family transporter [Effusibacillus dendaii]|uniref:Transporter protein n=1 Tax=Effusibacillus dendaii TaxID=2743772 RepID=A0A7I8DHV7_9BACL|nr:AmiS/UreI family transporter [Effusibacillus dendaii]BCJ88210.1 transporter protein [Effusibacillus dendaii]